MFADEYKDARRNISQRGRGEGTKNISSKKYKIFIFRVVNEFYYLETNKYA